MVEEDVGAREDGKRSFGGVEEASEVLHISAEMLLTR